MDMGCVDNGDPSGSRQPLPINLRQTAEEAFLGLVPTTCCVCAVPELEAVEIRIKDGADLVLSPTSALDIVLRLIGGLHRLERARRAREYRA
jgi:hypothetical protein